VVHCEEPADFLAQPGDLLRGQRGPQPVQAIPNGTDLTRAVAQLRYARCELGQLRAEVVVNHPQMLAGQTLAWREVA
jgi:hypothetical protein